MLTTLRVPIDRGEDGKLNAVALSPDGQIVAVGGWTEHGIYLFDRVTGHFIRRLEVIGEGVVNRLAFSPDGSTVAAILGGNYGLLLFSVANGKLIGKDGNYGGPSFSVHFSPKNGRLVTACLDGLLRVYNFDGRSLELLARVAPPGGKQPFMAQFSPDGKLIAVGFGDTPSVNVLVSSDLTLAYAPDTVGVRAPLASVAWSLDGKYLYAAGGAQERFAQNAPSQFYIRRWSSAGQGMHNDWPVTENTINDLLPLPGGSLAFASTSLGVMNADGSRHLFPAPSVADFRDNNKENFRLSADGIKVHFAYANNGKDAAVFDIHSRSLLLPDTTGLIAPVMIPTAAMEVTDWRSSYNPKLNGQRLQIDEYERSRSFALLPNGVGLVLGADWSLRLYDRNGNLRWEQHAPGTVWSVNVSQDGRWVVAAYGDGTIRWHRASDGKEQLAFFPHADKKRWIMWTPSGYYDAGVGAEDLIGWHVNRGKDNAGDFFPASRFHARFYRPDVLANVLKTQDEAVALAQANTEAGRKTQVVSIAQVLPPVVELVSPNEGGAVSTPNVTIRYRTRTPDDAPVTGIRVRVNGLAVSLPEARNLVVAAASGVREITLPIPPKDSVIQLFAENKNAVSAPAVLRLTWAGNKTATAELSRVKPTLYVLAVGVSQYKNPNYNLGLAAKDAQDFVTSLQSQKGRLYGDVVVRLLTDDKATKDDVLDGLDWLKHKVTATDVGIMFVAGHGMNDDLGNYYFLPHNVNPEQLIRTGVSQNDIKLTFASLQGRAVFFVDTCHSGGVLGSVKTDGFVNELGSAENGAVVFAASTAGQLSQEDPNWGNGAFTKSVVEGLSGKADLRKNGLITAKGLDYYVDDRVKMLTNQAQTPVSISPGGFTDFTIAVTGK